MVVQTTADPSLLTAAVRESIQAVDLDQPLYDIRPMTAVLERTVNGQWLYSMLAGVFALLAPGLASAGLYGVVSYLTAQRQREFGIRAAVGAKATDVLALVLKQGFAHAALLRQGRQQIDSGHSPCRRIAGENRGDYEDHAGQRQGSRIVGLGFPADRPIDFGSLTLSLLPDRLRLLVSQRFDRIYS